MSIIERSKQLNWKSGLFRTWVFGSLCWVTFAGVVYPDGVNRGYRVQQKRDGIERFWTTEDWFGLFGVTLGPPLLVLAASVLMFLILRWIVRGFLRE